MKLSRIVVYLWMALLAFSLYISARTSLRRALQTEEYAYACDSFGYLRSAKELRRAYEQRTWPKFELESPQTRLLIDFMLQSKIPVTRWDEAIAPHAHHYAPQSGNVIDQYPPGTGLVLSMFPQGEAVYGLNRFVVWVFTLTGFAALMIAAWKRAWATIGLVVLALTVGLIVIGRLGALSFSMNAGLVPILLTSVFTLIAMRFKTANRNRLAFLFTLLAGMSLGVATMVRLPSFLLSAGFLVLLWPGWRNLRIKSLPVVFALGVTLAGVLPVVINQQVAAGAWYLTTYSRADAEPPTLKYIGQSASYYLVNGWGAEDNWALVAGAIGLIGFLMLYLRRDSEASNRLGLSWKRFVIAVVLLWVPTLCYFLLHRINGPHYVLSALFATITLLGLGAFAIEITSNAALRFEPRRIVSWVALALILFPVAATLHRAWTQRDLRPAPASAITHAPILLPAELVDDKAWVWADLLTGSLWYYANKPAFKIQFTDPEVRAKMFKFVWERGERQYLIQDSEQMKVYIAEIEKLGGRLEMRGKVNGEPYFLVNWPSEGPR
jgi:MFS family permease